jgi:hypothetical protein
MAEPGQTYHLSIRSGEEIAQIGLCAKGPAELLKLGVSGQVFAADSRPAAPLTLPEPPPVVAALDLSPWFLIPAMILLTLDLLIRRIRL